MTDIHAGASSFLLTASAMAVTTGQAVFVFRTADAHLPYLLTHDALRSTTRAVKEKWTLVCAVDEHGNIAPTASHELNYQINKNIHIKEQDGK